MGVIMTRCKQCQLDGHHKMSCTDEANPARKDAVDKGKDYYVTVCDACSTASCWHGEHMCQRSKTSGTRQVTASRLTELSLEHPSNYSREKLLEVCGRVEWVESC
jgi:purine nucleoside permease